MDHQRASLVRKTSAASEMSPLRRKKPTSVEATQWITSEYKFTPFKSELSKRTVWSGGEFDTGKAQSEIGGKRLAEKTAAHDAEDAYKIGGRNTPNSLSAAWRNSYTLRKSTSDLTSDINPTAPVPTPRARSVSQSSRQANGGNKRLPLSLPPTQPAYMPYMMYNPNGIAMRPWSSCSYGHPWSMDMQMPVAPLGEVVLEKTQVPMENGQIVHGKEIAKPRSPWKHLTMIAILQLVLGVAIVTAGIIRSTLGASMSFGVEILIGLFIICIQVVTILGVSKTNWQLLSTSFVSSIIACPSLGFPIFFCIHALQGERPFHQHVVNVFVIVLCVAQMAVTAVSLAYGCRICGTILSAMDKENLQSTLSTIATYPNEKYQRKQSVTQER